MHTYKTQEELAKAVENAESLDQAIAVLKENGYTDADKLAAAAGNQLNGGELDEASLENVSGGAILPAFLALLEKLKGNASRQGSSGGWHTGGGRHG